MMCPLGSNSAFSFLLSAGADQGLWWPWVILMCSTLMIKKQSKYLPVFMRRICLAFVATASTVRCRYRYYSSTIRDKYFPKSQGSWLASCFVWAAAIFSACDKALSNKEVPGTTMCSYLIFAGATGSFPFDQEELELMWRQEESSSLITTFSVASGTTSLTWQLRPAVSAEQMEREETFNSRNSQTKFKIRLDKENVKNSSGRPFLHPLWLVMERSGLHLNTWPPQCIMLMPLVLPEAPFYPSHHMWLWCSGTVLQRCNGLCSSDVFGQMGEASADVLNYAFYS